MSEVETTEGVQSPPVPVEEQPVSGVEAEPSWQDQLRAEKARVAGKDRALTEAKQELARIKAEADALAAWKAEKERADMTEVERLKLQVAEYESAIAEARAAAQRAQLKAEFPQSFALLGEAAPLDPGVLAILEKRLSDEKEANEPAPPINPNNPRKGVVYQPTNPGLQQLQADVAKFGGLKGLPSFEAKVPMTATDR